MTKCINCKKLGSELLGKSARLFKLNKELQKAYLKIKELEEELQNVRQNKD